MEKDNNSSLSLFEQKPLRRIWEMETEELFEVKAKFEELIAEKVEQKNSDLA